MKNAAIEVKGLTKSYVKQEPILKDLNLQIQEGEIFGILGPNGSGKTTLLRLMCSLLKPDSGQILIQGQELERISRMDLAKILAFVPQETQIAFPFSVLEIVLQGRYPFLNSLGFEKAADHQVVRRSMELTDTWHLRNRWIKDLSGGERQRVIVARALAQSPKILFLDEPTSFLDIKHQVKIHEVLRRMNNENGLTVVCVLHDLTMASTYFDRLCLLHEQNIVSMGEPAEVMQYELIKNVYGAEVYIDINAVTGRPYIIPLGQVDQKTNKNG